jgi:hypothetical protein
MLIPSSSGNVLRGGSARLERFSLLLMYLEIFHSIIIPLVSLTVLGDFRSAFVSPRSLNPIYIFVPAPQHGQAIEVITKRYVAHLLHSAQPLYSFVPKASSSKLPRKYCGAVSH